MVCSSVAERPAGGAWDLLILGDSPAGQDLEALLDALPPELGDRMRSLENVGSVIEVVMDLGRVPEARFGGVAGHDVATDDLQVGIHQDRLVAVPFDPREKQMTGDPIVVLEDVYIIPALKGIGLAVFALSDTGTLVYVAGGAGGPGDRMTPSHPTSAAPSPRSRR